MTAPIVCPRCGHEHAPRIQIMAETSRRAGKRPTTPELVHVCPECGGLIILSLHPAPEGSAS